MKKLVSLGLVSLTVVALGATSVQAATGNTQADAISAQTDADIKFTADDTDTDPGNPEVVDPSDPNKGPGVIDPDKSDGKPGNGTASFNINWVSNFRFGEVKIGSTAITKFASPTYITYKPTDAIGEDPTKPVSEDNPIEIPAQPERRVEGLANFIQVTDNRGKVANGYKVSVEASEFVSPKQGEETEDLVLEGASLYLTGGRFIGLEGDEDLAPVTNLAPTTDLVGGTNTVIEAAPGKGVGTWTLAWGGTEEEPALLNPLAKAGVKLYVPVSAKAQADRTYTSTVTWELVSAPEIGE